MCKHLTTERENKQFRGAQEVGIKYNNPRTTRTYLVWYLTKKTSHRCDGFTVSGGFGLI